MGATYFDFVVFLYFSLDMLYWRLLHDLSYNIAETPIPHSLGKYFSTP